MLVGLGFGQADSDAGEPPNLLGGEGRLQRRVEFSCFSPPLLLARYVKVEQPIHFPAMVSESVSLGQVLFRRSHRHDYVIGAIHHMLFCSENISPVSKTRHFAKLLLR